MQYKDDHYIVETFGNYYHPNIKLSITRRGFVDRIIYEMYPLTKKSLKEYMAHLRRDKIYGYITLLKSVYNKL